MIFTSVLTGSGSFDMSWDGHDWHFRDIPDLPTEPFRADDDRPADLILRYKPGPVPMTMSGPKFISHNREAMRLRCRGRKRWRALARAAGFKRRGQWWTWQGERRLIG